MARSSNMTSKAHASSATYPEDTHRDYLFILAVTATTCAVGGGDAFTIPAGGFWEPWLAPTSQIVLTGSCVVVTDTRHP